MEEEKCLSCVEFVYSLYAFYETTMEMGDIPCSEALKGEGDGNFFS